MEDEESIVIMIDDISRCCGCEACVQKCPRDCIEMKADHEGFYYPYVNTSDCVECGLCNKVCPIQTVNSRINGKIPTAYAAFAQDDKIRKESTSGGVFSVLAGRVIDENGSVFGAIMSEDCKNVLHIEAQNLSDLEAMRGSKYVQSRIGDTYKRIEEELIKHRRVMFSGTPCQVGGLKRYLGREYENLICVDLICHGVPSPKLWKKYVEYREKCAGANLSKAFFRYKKYGWKNSSVLFKFSNNAEYSRVFSKDMFGRMFSQNICLRPACYQCHFKNLQRMSDITLADFWGCESICPELDDGKGLSLVLVHSSKGHRLLEQCSPCLVMKQVDERWSNENKAMTQSAIRPRNRDDFFERVDEKSIRWLYMKYLPVREKILMIVPTTIKDRIKKLIR